MRIGYVLAFTGGKRLRHGWQMLEKNGCATVYTDVSAGSSGSCVLPEREAALGRLRPGDVLVVPRLGLLGHSIEDLTAVFDEVDRRGAELHAVEEDLHTSPGGCAAVLQVLLAFTNFEEEMAEEWRQASEGREGTERHLDIESPSNAEKLLGARTRSASEEQKQLEAERSREGMALGDALDRLTRLEAQEKRFRSILTQASDVIMCVGPKGTIRYVSDTAERVVGFAPEQMEGATVFDQLHPEDRAEAEAVHEALLEHPGEKQRVEFRARHADGSWVHFETVARNLLGDEAVRGILISARDITERRRAEAEQRRSERRLRSIVENVSDVIFRVDREGRYTYLNPAWEEITGYSVEETLGKPFESYVRPEERERTREAFQRHLSGDATDADTDAKGRFIGEEYLVAAGGDLRWMRLSARRLTGEDGRVIGTTGTMTDLTESKRAKAEQKARKRAEELLAAKTTLLRNLSRELRAPLSAILGYAESIEQEGPAEIQEYSQPIEQSATRLMETLDSVLTLSKLESGEVSLPRHRVDLVGLVEETAQLMEAQAEEKELVLQTQLPGDRPVEVRTRSSVVERVLINLVSNAIKYTNAGTVTLRLSTDAEHAVLQVADTGTGISEAFLPHLFEDFTRQSSGPAHEQGGVGLGLTITQRFVALVGGEIDVESAEGEGSTFTVRLPR